MADKPLTGKRIEIDLVKARFSGMLRKAGIGAGLPARGAVSAFLAVATTAER